MALEREKNKLVIDKCQSILTDLLKDEDNKYCVDCDAKSPRWASWNIGIFLCIRCAGIHRNLGVHISRVKSVNLDSWTPQQVACIQQMGNSRARAVYEANVQDNFRRPQTDSSLEQFIRAKYEAKKYIAREWVPPELPTPTWDKELEKQLKRKREKKSSTGTIELPARVKTSAKKTSGISPKALPRAPGGRSSLPGASQSKRLSGTAAVTKKEDHTDEKTSGTIDLLGLDGPTPSSISNGTGSSATETSDIFGDFLAAPANPLCTSEMSKSVDASNVKDEESSFFNQKLPEMNEKMSKDSIMALYKQSSSQASVQGNTGGMYKGVCMPVVPLGVPIPGMMTPQQAMIASNQQQQLMFSPQPVLGMQPPPQYPFLPMGGAPGATIPGMPNTVQLSADNPFSHVQTQMGNISLGRMAAPYQPNNPVTMGPMGMTNVNGLMSPSQTNNLWQ